MKKDFEKKWRLFDLGIDLINYFGYKRKVKKEKVGLIREDGKKVKGRFR